MSDEMTTEERAVWVEGHDAMIRHAKDARIAELEGALREAKEGISRWPVHLGETIAAIDRVLKGTE